MIAAAIANKDLLIAASTIWVVVTAVLVMFMQAGFAFLEAGLTRMKNAGHIAGKNVLIFGLCSIVYWMVGFGIAFGDGGWFSGTAGFFPSVNSMIAVGQKPFDFFTEIPGAAGYLFEVVFAGVSLAIVWGAMAERAKLWVYFVFGIWFTITYSIVSHWIWNPHGWLFKRGMQDFAGSTVVHYQGALAGLAGALILGPRIGKFGKDGRANPIPGHNIPFAVLGTLILWFGWFGFNPGSTLSVDFGGFGYFGYVALTTNIAAATGAVTGMVIAWLKLGKPDISMMLNGALGALVAITAASGFVAPWAAIVIGAGSGRNRGVRRHLRGADRHRRSDRRSCRARHVRGLGHACLRALRGADPVVESCDGHQGSRVRGRVPPARRTGARPRRGWRVHVRDLVRLPLGAEQDLGHPRVAGSRDAGTRRARARHVGLPRVLHPGSGRLRHREPRASRRRAPPRTGGCNSARDPGKSGDVAMTCMCVKPMPVERATRKGAARTECAGCGKQIRLTLGKGRRFGAVPSQPT